MLIPLRLIDLPANDLRESIDLDGIAELADSMHERGLKQPIGVRIKDLDQSELRWASLTPNDLPSFENRGDRFEVVFGARRTRAAQSLEWTHIEATVLHDTDDRHTAADKLIENVQRENLTPMEETNGLLSLIGDDQPDVRRLQKQTGKSREWVKSRLALALMPEDMQAALQTNLISMGVALELSKIEHDETRRQYLSYAIDGGCTADQAKIWVNQAQFAESGIMSMQQHDQDRERISAEPQVVDQKYNCFCCQESKTWRQINTLVVCGNCQDAIAEARQQTVDPPHRPPVDTHVNL